MPKQVSNPPSLLEKNLLISAIVLMVSSFIFFYWATKVNFEYVSRYNDTIYLNHSSDVSYNFGAGTQIYYNSAPAMPWDMHLQPGDWLTATYDPSTPTDGTVYIVLWEVRPAEVVVAHSGSGVQPLSKLDYGATFEMWVDIHLAALNETNVVPVTITIQHHEPPNWFLFGAGVFLASLGLVTVFMTKKIGKTITCTTGTASQDSPARASKPSTRCELLERKQVTR